jgi:hypothetical protein
MIVKRNRHNTNFQIAYFIAGSCFTPDAAYFALLNQRDERQAALDAAVSSGLRRQARRIEIDRASTSDDPVDQLKAQADLHDWQCDHDKMTQLEKACEEELAFIDLCIERVQPLRKFSHLPDGEAAEVCQREEFAREFQFRIENYLMTQGTIPHDQLASMRQHPDFGTQLLPHITHVTKSLSAPGGAQHLLPNLTKTFDLPAVIGYSNAT